MCGIAGIIDFKGNRPDEDLVRGMTDTMAHRGPDDKGYFFDNHVGLGHRRLSIIDIKTGHQPMDNEDGTIVIVFNGEIYNFPELKSLLRDRNHVFKTHSDTEVVIHAYEEWGRDCVKKFNGMFAFAIYDKNKKEIILMRDRLGIKPLHYAVKGSAFIFGSEMKAILAHKDFSRSANLSAVSSYLTFRYPQGEQTVFNGIKRLLPGHMMVVSKKGVETIKYWEIPFHAIKEDKGEAFYLKETERLLKAAVKRRMISDVPLGAFLSGGLDSSVVVALMSKISSDPVKTFYVGFKNEGYNENPFAEIVSGAYKTDHHSIMLSRTDYMKLLPKLIKQKDAPLSIPHEVALYQMSVELKKHITVVISGEGADELFGGYGRVQRSPMDYKKILFVQKRVPKPLQKSIAHLMGAGNQSDKWLAVKSHMEHFFSVYNWVPFNEKHALFTEEVNEKLQLDSGIIDEWEKIFESVAAGDPYDRILYVFEKMHLICLLDRLDSMTMAASVEARVPFVDHELVEFVSAIPRKYKLRWRSPLHKTRAVFVNSFKASEWLDESKSILRRVARDLLPREIYSRKKLGFPVPLDAWIKDGLISHAKEMLLDPRAGKRGIFKREKIEELLRKPQGLDYDFWGKKIWMLMNIEMWFRGFIDKG